MRSQVQSKEGSKIQSAQTPELAVHSVRKNNISSTMLKKPSLFYSFLYIEADPLALIVTLGMITQLQMSAKAALGDVFKGISQCCVPLPQTVNKFCLVNCRVTGSV